MENGKWKMENGKLKVENGTVSHKLIAKKETFVQLWFCMFVIISAVVIHNS